MNAESFDVDLVFPPRPGIEVVAAETAASLALYGGAGETTAGDVRLAIIEACVNAIEHAYRGDCDTPGLQITFRLTPETNGAPARLTIWIRDSGEGFDLSSYEEPVLEEKLHARDKRGWGLKLIRGLMDEFQIVSGQAGTTVEMTKVLSS